MPDQPSKPRSSPASSEASDKPAKKKARRKKSTARRKAQPRSAEADGQAEPKGQSSSPSGAKATKKRAAKKTTRKKVAKAASKSPAKSRSASKKTKQSPSSPQEASASPSLPRRPGPSLSGGELLIGGRSKGGKGKGKPKRKPQATPTPPSGPRETFRGLTLNDFQMRALGPLREGRPVLLAAPTGAGKTLVAELAIEMSLKAGKRAIYTAPIKALSNQKYRDFKAIDPNMVGLMTGDVTINPGAPVLIMTTEIFRNT
ncbi:MAG: superfamily II RNA helicase, partial [Pseudohongiellaceae bacterium]